MDTYLAPAGALNLQNAFNGGIVSNIDINGYQIGSSVGFTPDNTMVNAQGLLLDKKSELASVKMTPIHLHEIILTVILDQSLEFTGMGNILIFANNQPFIWSVSPVALPKVKTDPVGHFAGDKYYFPILLRYPYIRSLVTFNNSAALSAKFPVYDKLTSMPRYPEERPNADQVFVEKNNLWYGRVNPYLAFRTKNGWMANPIMKDLNEGMGSISGGTTLTGF